MTSDLLEELAPHLFAYDAGGTTLGMRIGHRMTVIQLGAAGGGGLWIHSPAALDDKLWSELDALAPPSEPRHLIIPSRTHDLHVEEWMQRIPPATTFAPAAIGRVHPDWRFDGVLTADLVAPWSAELPHVRLLGAPRVNEVAFLHEPTRTLILVDSVFNLCGPQPLFGGLLLRLNGCRSGIATGRLFRATIKDKSAFASSLERILAWDFERVVVGHGAVLEANEIGKLRTHLASLAKRSQ
jgi:hypothetical protein